MLTATLDTKTDESVVRFRLIVENDGDESVDLSFRDGQRAEFLVQSDDDPVWRWSEGQMFMQMLGSETVEPGEKVEYEGMWEEPSSGTYEALGELVAEGHHVRAETTFSV